MGHGCMLPEARAYQTHAARWVSRLRALSYLERYALLSVLAEAFPIAGIVRNSAAAVRCARAPLLI